MARQAVDLGQESVELRPEAAPVQSFVQAAADPNAGKDLMELAESLKGFYGQLDQYVDAAGQQQKKDDEAAGQAAFYKNNGQGFAAGVANGSIPAQASPTFMHAYNEQQGSALGGDLSLKWQQAYDGWDGKNATGPDAQKNFEAFRSKFFTENLPANMDPQTAKGVVPHLDAITRASNNQFMQDQHQLVYNGGIQTGATVLNQNIDRDSAVATNNGTKPDYDKAFALGQQAIDNMVKQGITREDATKAVNKSFIDNSIKYKDQGYLGWFGKQNPATGATYGNTPEGQEAYDSARKTVDRLSRQDLADDARQHEAQQKQDKINTTAAIQDVLAKNPRAPIDPAVLQKAKLLGIEPTSIQGWRDTLSKGMPSDQNGLTSLYTDMMANPGASQATLNKALSNGLFTQSSDLKDAAAFQRTLASDPDGVTKILSDPQAQKLEGALMDRLQQKNELGQPIAGYSDQAFQAQSGFRRSLAEWQLQNPNATVLQKQDAINKIGAGYLSAVAPPATPVGPGSDSKFVPGAAPGGAAGGSPYGTMDHAVNPAAAAADQQTKQQAQIDAQEAQRPGWWKRMTDSSGAAALNQQIDAREALIRGQPAPAPAVPKVTTQAYTPEGYAAWRGKFNPASQAALDAAVQKQVAAGVTPEQAQQAIFAKANPQGAGPVGTAVAQPAQGQVPNAMHPLATQGLPSAPGAAVPPGRQPPGAAPAAAPAAAHTGYAPGSPEEGKRFLERAPNAETMFQQFVTPDKLPAVNAEMAKRAAANGTTVEQEKQNLYQNFVALQNEKIAKGAQAAVPAAAPGGPDPAVYQAAKARMDALQVPGHHMTQAEHDQLPHDQQIVDAHWAAVRAQGVAPMPTVKEQDFGVQPGPEVKDGKGRLINKTSFSPTDTPGQMLDKAISDPHGALEAAGVPHQGAQGDQAQIIKTALGAMQGGIDEGYAKAFHPDAGYTPVAATGTDKQSGSILDFIASHEGGDYNRLVGERQSTHDLSKLTLNQVYQLQDQMKAQGKESTAVGRYQFIKGTLQQEARKEGLTGNEIFTPQLQDRLAIRLMRTVGYDDWKAGKISDGQFGNNLATQWASLPRLTGPGAGKGVYDGVGSNKALGSTQKFAGALAGAKNGTAPTPMGSDTPKVEQAVLRQGDPNMRDDFNPYAKLPPKDDAGRDQVANFKRYNPDPVGNESKVLEGISPDLASVVQKAKGDNPDIPFVIGGGKRSYAQQEEDIKNGMAKTKDLQVAAGTAMDVWPLDAAGHVIFDPAAQARVEKALNTAASGLGVVLEKKQGAKTRYYSRGRDT